MASLVVFQTCCCKRSSSLVVRELSWKSVIEQGLLRNLSNVVWIWTYQMKKMFNDDNNEIIDAAKHDVHGRTFWKNKPLFEDFKFSKIRNDDPRFKVRTFQCCLGFRNLKEGRGIILTLKSRIKRDTFISARVVSVRCIHDEVIFFHA